MAVICAFLRGAEKDGDKVALPRPTGRRQRVNRAGCAGGADDRAGERIMGKTTNKSSVEVRDAPADGSRGGRPAWMPLAGTRPAVAAGPVPEAQARQLLPSAVGPVMSGVSGRLIAERQRGQRTSLAPLPDCLKIAAHPGLLRPGPTCRRVEPARPSRGRPTLPRHQALQGSRHRRRDPRRGRRRYPARWRDPVGAPGWSRSRRD